MGVPRRLNLGVSLVVSIMATASHAARLELRHMVWAVQAWHQVWIRGL